MTMRSVLRAIPLPLRIAAFLVIMLAAYGLVGKASSSLFATVAIVLWTLTLVVWMYDQGWLNPLARVPVLSRVLGFISNRTAVTANAPGGGSGQPPPAELDDAERRRLLSAAQESLASLRGNEAAKEAIFQRIVAPAVANPKNAFSTNAPATLVIIAGPHGIGKTSVAHAIAQILTGAGALKTAKITTVIPTDLRGGEFGSAIELARTKAKAARGGALLIDDAEWLLTPDPYLGQHSPGVDFGVTIVDVLREAPGETVVIATMDEKTLGQLKEDTAHERWFGKLGRREIVFSDLDNDALLEVLESSLAAMNWRLLDEEAGQAARRMLADIRDRKGASFGNAEACRRTAEILIEIATEDFPDLTEKRVISREVVRVAEDEVE